MPIVPAALEAKVQGSLDLISLKPAWAKQWDLSPSQKIIFFVFNSLVKEGSNKLLKPIPSNQFKLSQGVSFFEK
jgi:hypothetical protein